MRILLIIGMLVLGMEFSAQKVKTVSAEYIYYAPENVSIEHAKRIALDRAKIQAIADEFGTIVTQNNSTIISQKNGKSSIDLISIGGSDVKGEWIETIDEPKYEIRYEQNQLIIRCFIKGKAREIISAGIEFIAKPLRNGTSLKFESTEFKDGDDLFLYFQSPIDGYLAVYLLDDVSQMVYCLLPYKNSSGSVIPIEKEKPYIFFSTKHADDKEHLVDEYTMICNNSVERNTIYVIFSPNEFVKANSNNVEELLPQELSFEEFQKWLVKGRNRDKYMSVRRIQIVIN